MDVTRIDELTAGDKASFFERNQSLDTIQEDVEEIITEVRERGDAALREYAQEFDGVDQNRMEITDELDKALESIDDDLQQAIETAAQNIRTFHNRQRREDWRVEVAPGRKLGRQFRPIERVGVYVPGGLAGYPSSALMGVIPADVAGVDQIAVTTPPATELDRTVLAALAVAGADRVYAAGGAQGIAALAYGTETIDQVHKIVGPGNNWVTAAKAQVRGRVDIDFLAGPSEVLVIADRTADPSYIAADLLAQAEHDPASSVVAITTEQPLADAIEEELETQRRQCTRSEVIADALSHESSGILIANSLEQAIEFANRYAPEHLSIQAEQPAEIADQVSNAGSVFLGPFTPVAAGDYATGTNHILPTGGMASVTGGLSVDTFLRARTIQRLTKSGLTDLRSTITTLAETEGLDSHARSIEQRFES